MLLYSFIKEIVPKVSTSIKLPLFATDMSSQSNMPGAFVPISTNTSGSFQWRADAMGQMAVPGWFPSAVHVNGSCGKLMISAANFLT